MQSCPFYKMDPKKSKNLSPRIKVIQKLYIALMNPDALIEYPKSQYKKFIKDVVTGTLERSDLIEEQIKSLLVNDINLDKTDKLLKIILFAAIFELMFKHNTPKKVIISEYLIASEHGELDSSQQINLLSLAAMFGDNNLVERRNKALSIRKNDSKNVEKILTSLGDKSTVLFHPKHGITSESIFEQTNKKDHS